jgi:hypothetical protein
MPDKTMVIKLFDPGEGGNSIQIRKPTGPNSWENASSRWSVDGGASGSSTTSLDVTGSKFDGKLVTLEVDLAGYAPPSSNQWWQIRYNFGGGKVTDRTTWSVSITGDPVHLVEETELTPRPPALLGTEPGTNRHIPYPEANWSAGAGAQAARRSAVIAGSRMPALPLPRQR